MKDKNDYRSFCDAVLAKLNSKLQSEGMHQNAEISSIVCRNDKKRDAVTFCSNEGGRQSPVVYLDDFYDRYGSGDINLAVDELCNILVEHSNDVNESQLEAFLDHEIVKNRVSFRLINMKLNEFYLADKVFRNYLDLAIVYQIGVDIAGGKGQIVIRKN